MKIHKSSVFSHQLSAKTECFAFSAIFISLLAKSHPSLISHISLLPPIAKALPRPTQAGFIRLTKKTLVTYLITFLVFSGTGLFYLFNPFGTKTTQAAWFNDSWVYRKAITITSSNSGTTTNLQYLLTVDTTGITSKLQTSCQDLRFTSTNGDVLPYYIPSSCSNNSATNKIWVLLNSVPNGTSTIYMYYGNPSAAAGTSSNQFDNLVSLSGYWPMNEGTGSTVNDRSVNTNTGTLTIAASGTQTTTTQAWTAGATGQYGGSINFDGTDDKIDAGTALDLSDSSFTLEAWAKKSANGNIDMIIGEGTNVADQGLHFGYNNDNKFRCSFWSDDLNDTTAITDTSWHHFACTYDTASKIQKLYRDGTFITSRIASANYSKAAETLNIGYFDSSTSYFHGQIDDVKIYKGSTRTDEQIAKDYATSYSIATITATPTNSFSSEEKGAAPISYWKFDDAQGVTAQDAMANNNDGTLAASTATPTWQSADQCISGGCLFYDGSNDKVTVANTISGVQSVGFWVKPNAFTSTTPLIDLNGTAMIVTNSSGVISATGFTSPTIYVNGVVGTTISSNTWSYVMVTTGTVLSASAIKLATDTTNFMKGFIDEVKIYNQALTASQVLANYSARSNPEGVASALGANTQNMSGALSNGLVGYWKLDEADGAAPVDSSGNGNNLTDVATVPRAAGKFGSGSDYEDGSSQYQYMADSASLSVTGSVTLSLWKKAESGAFNQLMGKWDGSNESYRLYQYNSDIEFTIDSSTDYVRTSGLGMTVGTWYHIVGVFNATNRTMKIYVNGVEATTVLTGTVPASISDDAGAFAIGAEDRNNTPKSFYDGVIDEARVYNRALSPAEVSQLYNWAPGPLGYWKMDEGTGSSVADQSGNAYTATLVGSPAWAQGKYGKSTVYDSSAGKYAYATNALPVNDFTYSAWVNMTSNASARTIFAAESVAASGDNDEFILWSTPNATQTLSVVTNGSSKATSTGTIPLNTWTHVAVTRIGSAISLYINGTLDGTGTDASALSFETGCNLYIGGDPTNGCDESNTLASNFYGSIDEAKVFNYGQTATQIAENMNAGHPAPGSPVGSAAGWWKFNEGADNMCSGGTNDVCNSGSIGNAIDGTLTASSRTTAGKFGGALDGATDRRAAIADNANLDFAAAEDFSLSLWFKSDSATNPSANEYLVEKGGNITTDAIGYAIYTSAASDGLVCFGIDDDAAAFPEDSVCSTNDVYDNTWHHLLAKKTGTSRLDLYIDGQANGTADTAISATGTLANAASFYIGDTNATDGTDEFLGDLDEVKVFRSALTQAQAQLDMNQGQSQIMGATSTNSNFASTNIDNTAARTANSAASEYCIPGDSTTCTAPVGRWNLEEGTGTTAFDSSGNANTGTITAGSGVYTKGKIGKGYSFDSADTIIDAGSGSVLDNLPAAGMTTELWYYPRTLGESSVGFILSKNTGASQNQGWFLLNLATNSLQFVVDGSTDLVVQTSNNSITLNTWNHISLSWNGTFTSASAVHIYVNGVETGYQTQTNGATRVDDAASNFYLGNSSTLNRTVDGVIDDVRIFNYARSAAQIAWDYNKGLPLAHYKMDECQGTALNNSINSSFAGTLTATSTVGTCNTSSTFWGGSGGTGSGKRNYAPTFNGTGDYITIANASSLPANNASQTLSAWFYYTSTPSGVDDILALTNTASSSITVLQARGSTLGAYKWAGSALVTTSAPSTNAWHNIIYTYDGTTNSLYMDGRLVTTSVTAPNTATPTTAFISDYTTGGGEFWQGLLDDVRIYNYALTTTQVKTLYNEGAIRFGPSTGAP